MTRFKDIFDSWKYTSVQLILLFVPLAFVAANIVVIFCKMKMILLPKQTVTDITSIAFCEHVLNKHSISNHVKTWIDMNNYGVM